MVTIHRISQIENYHYPLAIYRYTKLPLYAAIYSIWACGRHPEFFLSEMRDNPMAMLYRNELAIWNAIGDWVLKKQFKLFDLADSPYGEEFMLIVEPIAKVAIAERLFWVQVDKFF
jgi:hypothetical protein